MEYLLSWVFDHFIEKVYIKNIDIKNIEKLISEHISEIDCTEKILIEKEKLFIARVENINNENILLKIIETNKEIKLTHRSDANVGLLFLVKKNKNSEFEWVRIKDLGGKRENLVPSFKADEKDLNGLWKNKIENIDYLIKIDNKSIGNRPDLFSHRGFARELTYFLDNKLKREDEIVADCNLTKVDNKGFNNNILKNDCKNVDFCAVSILDNIPESESSLFELIRLCMVDQRPKSFLIDISNYVMLDIGHPMHVFDKDRVKMPFIFNQGKSLSKLDLLDGSKIDILEEDIVIEDSSGPISLAGIMGGEKTAVSLETKSIVIEAAVFDKNCIKKSVKNHNKRTESSTRFEKGLNKNGVILALKRFIHILSLNQKINKPEIIFDGMLETNINKIELLHKDIEKIIGDIVDTEIITKISYSLGFKLEKIILNNDIFYKIEVPWWRSDINIKEDFIEEIARYIGYNNIKQIPPNINFDLNIKKKYFVEKAKNWSVNSFKGTEVLTYGILNEETAKTLEFNVENLVKLKNGYSNIQNKLTSSLIPHMMQILQEEVKNGNKDIRIFEIGQIWENEVETKNSEKKVFSIVWFQEGIAQFDFYAKKVLIEDFFKNIGIDINWKKINKNKIGLLSEISSSLYFKDIFIGNVGFIKPENVFSIYKSRGSVFALEIYYEIIEEFEENLFINEMNSFFDLSFLILKNKILIDYIDIIKKKINLKIKIYDIDWFEKDDWKDQRSVTIRIYFNNRENKELLKNECELILKEIGCIVR
jgi:phenylalanyl-tRNA synthetase beta chain